MSTNLTVEIMDALDEWNADFQKMVDGVMKKTAKEAVEQLSQNSSKRTGDYAAGWKMKTNKKSMSYVVYNKDHYRLTHLLENGHVNRDGSRTPAQKHIKPVEEWSVREVETGIEKGAKRI